MTVKYVKRDITSITVGVVAHGVNCQHKFASGIAGAIRKKWPQVYRQYMGQAKGKMMLGFADPVYVDDELIIVNCYTQLYYGRDGRRYADEQAIEESLMKAAVLADIHDLHLCIPRIGCGLGGLDWDKDVNPIVQKVADHFDHIDIFVCDMPQEISDGTNATRGRGT